MIFPMKSWRTFTATGIKSLAGIQKNILRSFVKQLSISSSQDMIQDCLVQLYNQKRREGFSSNKLSFAESEALLFQLIRPYSRTFLVLDALDECDKSLRGQLIEVFNRLLSTAKGLSIFISSRRDADIKYQFEKKANVEIEATDNQNDIITFVAERIESSQLKRRIKIPENLQRDVIQTILDKSEGM
jgi:hypothetical protein